MNTSPNPMSMIKTFSLKKIEHKIVTPRKGMLTYHVVDENNVARKVACITLLNRKKEIKNRKAGYKREIPLMDALSGLQPGQNITVDFSHFNKTFKRSNTTLKGSAYTEESLLEQVMDSSFLFPTIIKYSSIAASLYFIFIGYLYLKSLYTGIY